MTKICKRGVSLLMAAALMLGMIPAAGASEALGTELRGRTTTVAEGVTVTDHSLWSATYSDLRTEHYITYMPGTGVTPAAAYGGSIVDKRSILKMAADLEAQGLRVVGGINANFYDSNGTPIGLVVSGGEVKSSYQDYYAVGFKADGSAVIGRPVVTMSASWTTRERVEVDEEGLETVIPSEERWIQISGFNKIRQDGGFFLFSDIYASTTKNTVTGMDVVLRPAQGLSHGGLPLGADVPCEVVSLRDSKEDNSIPAGCFVLSVNQNSGEWRMNTLSELQPGDQVVVRASAEGEWADVAEGLSGLYSLVEDGKVNESAPADGRAPRTAVGVRADGGVVLYTIDGRRDGYSIGATYSQVADRMIELGCVQAIAMDGGGSTSCGTTLADSAGFQMVNRSSDSSARSVSTCLFLTEPAAGGTGELGSYYVSVENDLVLPGASVSLGVTAVDTAYYPMAWPGAELTWEAQLGSVSSDGAGGWVYTAPVEAEGNQIDTLTVSGGGVSGGVQVRVVDQTTAIAVRDQSTGKTVTTLQVKPNETVDLSAAAGYYNLAVTSGDAQYTWAADPAVGVIDGAGRFTAGALNAVGHITLTGGGRSVSIPVSVWEEGPFVDTREDWARDYILRLYQLGITTGVTGEDGQVYFYPGRTITRGELLTLVVRMLGEDVSQYDDVELPFADAAEIDGWLLPYARTAYALGLFTGAERNGALYADLGALVTRESAMTMIGRALGQEQEADLSAYEDADQVDDWARPYVETLVSLGVVQGSEGRLSPNANITRGEIAKIISAGMGAAMQ